MIFLAVMPAEANVPCPPEDVTTEAQRTQRARHCEERSDEAIQAGVSARAGLDCFASLAVTVILCVLCVSVVIFRGVVS